MRVQVVSTSSFMFLTTVLPPRSCGFTAFSTRQRPLLGMRKVTIHHAHQLSAATMTTTSAGSANNGCKQPKIYLDWNGTTPIYKRVLEAMMPYFTEHFGNPSSGHWAGTSPRRAVDNARRQILQLMGISVDDSNSSDLSSVWFTSCGTESDNLAIHLALQQQQQPRTTTQQQLPHIVTCNVEHPAIEKYLQRMESEKRCRVTYVPVQPDGCVLAEDVIKAIDKDSTVLVTLMLANNESGALQPVQQVAQYCREHFILCHTDAAQAAGKVSLQLQDLGNPDMVTLVGHKLGAPKGVACLYVRPGCLPSDPQESGEGGVLLIGGGQEFGRRGGTENVPYIVGLGEAAEIASDEWKTNAAKMEKLRTRLLSGLSMKLPRDSIRVIGPSQSCLRLPNTLSVGLKDVHSGILLAAISDRVAASAGATCHSDEDISSVLRAMNVPEEFARGTLRLSVGPDTSEEEIDQAIEIIATAALQQLAIR